MISDTAVGKPDDLINTGLSQVKFWVDGYQPAELDPAKLPDGYNEKLLGAGTVDGKTYVAPFQISAPVLFVNNDLLRSAGLDPKTPIASYDDLVAAAKQISVKTGKPSISISTDGLPDWFAQGFVQSAGGNYVNQDGTAGFGDETGVAALGIWERLAKDKTLLNVGGTDAMAEFTAGSLPFFVYTTSTTSMISEGINGKFDWMPVDLRPSTAR